MKTYSYNESYLPHAMMALATMMDCGINKCGFSPDLFFSMFLTSGIADQFEKGNPKYICGMSGAEIADTIIFKITGNTSPHNDGSYSVSKEYWAGWVLAYYQWKSGKSFRFMQNNGLEIEKVIALYNPLHEADLEKFSDTADEIISNYAKASESPLKKARERIGITQKELSIKANVSLRMIRAYEQKKQPLSNANFSTVSSIASALYTDDDEIAS